MSGMFACFIYSFLLLVRPQCRAKIIFKTHADSGQPWDLAARASTLELFLGSLSQSPALTLSLSLSLSQRDLVFVKATNGNFQLGSEGGERKGVRGKCEKAPSKDSIRRDQIKLLASSAPEADSLTMCPIWASGTAGAGALGGPEVTATSCTSTPGDPDNNTDNNTKDISSQIQPYRENLQRGCHVGSRQCVTVLR